MAMDQNPNLPDPQNRKSSLERPVSSRRTTLSIRQGSDGDELLRPPKRNPQTPPVLVAGNENPRDRGTSKSSSQSSSISSSSLAATSEDSVTTQLLKKLRDLSDRNMLQEGHHDNEEGRTTRRESHNPSRCYEESYKHRSIRSLNLEEQQEVHNPESYASGKRILSTRERMDAIQEKLHLSYYNSESLAVVVDGHHALDGGLEVIESLEFNLEEDDDDHDVSRFAADTNDTGMQQHHHQEDSSYSRGGLLEESQNTQQLPRTTHEGTLQKGQENGGKRQQIGDYDHVGMLDDKMASFATTATTASSSYADSSKKEPAASDKHSMLEKGILCPPRDCAQRGGGGDGLQHSSRVIATTPPQQQVATENPRLPRRNRGPRTSTGVVLGNDGFPLPRPGAYPAEGPALGVAAQYRHRLQQRQHQANRAAATVSPGASIVRNMRLSTIVRALQAGRGRGGDGPVLVEAEAVEDASIIRERSQSDVEARIRKQIIEDSAIANVVEERGTKSSGRLILCLVLLVLVLSALILGLVFGQPRGSGSEETSSTAVVSSTASPSASPTDMTIDQCSVYTVIEESLSTEAIEESFGLVVDRLEADGLLTGELTLYGSAEEPLCSPQRLSVYNMAIQIARDAPGAFDQFAIRYALGVFFFSLGGEDWVDNSGWLNDADFCGWVGIDCFSQLLYYLSLPDNGLEGRIPWEISALSNLEYLELQSNEIEGLVPSEIGHLQGLELLNLEFNNLDELPTEIGLLERLEGLYLSQNAFRELPSEVGLLTYLEDFLINHNDINGTIPTEISGLSEVVFMDLSNNQFSGEIPSLESMQRLEQLYLEENKLSGPIPSDIGALQRIEDLWLHNNMLTGTIPSEIGNLYARLTSLSLYGNNLTGTIPTELCELTELDELILSFNNLVSTIPTQISRLTRIEFLHLDFNLLTGPIPTEIGLLYQLENLDLTGNSLRGFPTELGTAKNLESLVLSDNDLSATIPVEICHLERLTNLNVARAHLFGSIPAEIPDLAVLTSLDISSNGLTGPLPAVFPPALRVLSLQDNSLTGSFMDTPTPSLEHVFLSRNDLNGTLPSQLDELHRLVSLKVDGNEMLSGTLPRLRLRNLRLLSVNETSLSGAVPDGICEKVDDGILEFSFDCGELECSCCDC